MSVDYGPHVEASTIVTDRLRTVASERTLELMNSWRHRALFVHLPAALELFGDSAAAALVRTQADAAENDYEPLNELLTSIRSTLWDPSSDAPRLRVGNEMSDMRVIIAIESSLRLLARHELTGALEQAREVIADVHRVAVAADAGDEENLSMLRDVGASR